MFGRIIGEHVAAHCGSRGAQSTVGRSTAARALPCASSCHHLELLRDHEGAAARPQPYCHVRVRQRRVRTCACMCPMAMPFELELPS